MRVFGGDETVRRLLTTSLATRKELVQFLFILDSLPLSEAIRVLRTPKNRRVLIRLEAPATNPLAYSWFASLLFNRFADIDFIKPQCRELPIALVRNSLPVMVQADKLSMASGELYSLRRKIIDGIECALYGPGWDKTIPSRIFEFMRASVTALLALRLSAGGAHGWFRRRAIGSLAVEDKVFETSKYHTAIVIENDLSKLTEKLYDALFAGCIPVYVGPQIPDGEIPSNLYFRSEPNFSALEESLEKASKRSSEVQKRMVDVWQRSACKRLELDKQLSAVALSIAQASQA